MVCVAALDAVNVGLTRLQEKRQGAGATIEREAQLAQKYLQVSQFHVNTIALVDLVDLSRREGIA